MDRVIIIRVVVTTIRNNGTFNFINETMKKKLE
jgi:hypothetical protein